MPEAAWINDFRQQMSGTVGGFSRRADSIEAGTQKCRHRVRHGLRFELDTVP
jgi:hypothetical protein